MCRRDISRSVTSPCWGGAKGVESEGVPVKFGMYKCIIKFV